MKLGEFIERVDIRNTELITSELSGINIEKEFMPSVANQTGLDLSKYKLVPQGHFAFNPMHVGRDRALPIAYQRGEGYSLVSPAYTVFKIKEGAKICPEYFMMWVKREDFDYEVWFYTDTSVRGGFRWDSFCSMEIKYIDPSEQLKTVETYRRIEDKIELNNKLNEQLLLMSEAFRGRVFNQ